MLKSSRKSVNVVPTNSGPPSVVISFGNPWCFACSRMDSLTPCAPPFGLVTSTHPENLSTVTRNRFPCSSMKSMHMLSNGCSGSGSGTGGSFGRLGAFSWQRVQVSLKRLMSSTRPGQYNVSAALAILELHAWWPMWSPARASCLRPSGMSSLPS